ncbi:hypothetical protein [Calycomorphotria hydatis]|uniref:Uncharacterized protein n=1 Tax=Calycomorphotria hydatis TaxID=2528027 RepID=A0A517T6V8_9PLAN|nr:hypothetical protein [Calycomorphotria hydatis]QDT64112.1 hypothetical protein V22_13430 [Calycomorphotria hydatis]
MVNSKEPTEDRNWCEVKRGCLYVGGTRIPTRSKIRDHHVFPDRVIICLQPDEKLFFGNNIECYDPEGRLLWVIDTPEHCLNVKNPDFTPSPFVNLKLIRPKALLACTWSSVEYLVDLQNGRVTYFQFTK